jgi:transcriptional regulator GlxA family with amidase domain
MHNPIQVSVYVDDNCWAGLAILIKEALAIAGTLHARSSDLTKSALFEVKLVALSEQAVTSFTGPLITPEQTIYDTATPQVIVITSFFFTANTPTPIHAELRRWLIRSYKNGAILMGLASGVRILAETGLLDGHEVTGNLSDQRVFAEHYPNIRFSTERPLVIDGRIISAASINPCLDACAYLVSQFYGEAAAHKFTRFTNSTAQPTYEKMALVSAPWKQHTDQRIKQAQEFIERHFKQDISVEDAARRAAMSVRNFSRRFQLAVGMSAVSYIARCRVEHAKVLLAQAHTPMLQVALQSGFNNLISFRRAIHQFCAKSPTQYRKDIVVNTTQIR